MITCNLIFGASGNPMRHYTNPDLLTITTNANANGNDKIRKDKPDMEAFPHSQAFALRGTGFSGALTKSMQWVLKVSTHHDCERAYLDLIQSDNHQARLYGLAGLKLINSPSFTMKADVMVNDVTHVNGMKGCVLFRDTVGRFVRDIVAYNSRNGDGTTNI